MEIKQNYSAPRCEVFEVRANEVLCQSATFTGFNSEEDWDE